MAAIIFGGVTVPEPPPGPQRYGLFNASTILDMPEHARIGGVQFIPDSCGIARLYSAACPITAQALKTLTDTQDLMTAAPFVAYGSVVCSPVGSNAEMQRQRAIKRLFAGEQTQAELALWNGGAVGATPALTLAGATVVATAATQFGARLAALEEAFYSAHGYQGVVHVNTAAYGAAAFGDLIISPSSMPPSMPQILTTPLGSLWSFGAGYDITGPANAAPAAGSVWAFMTGPMTIWRTPDGQINAPDPAMTMNRSTNQMVALAEREYVQSYHCPEVFAIQLPVEAP